MNIAFFYDKGTLPVIGGVASISYNLGMLFRKRGHHVFFIGIKDLHYLEYDKNQTFLINNNLLAETNIQYIEDYIRRNEIQIIINQTGSYNLSYISFLDKVRNRIKSIANRELYIITCFHTSIYTNVLNIAYEKEHELKKKHIGFVFHLLKLKVVYHTLLCFFIKKHRRQYREVINLSNLTIVLCPGQEYELKRMAGMMRCEKIKIINNTLFDFGKIIDESKKENVVLWVGAFDYSIKRPDFMLKIWSSIQNKFPSWKLILLGDGSNFEDAKNLSKELNLKNVEFKGRVESSTYFEKAKFLCMTSTHEAFPMVLMEAMNYKTVPFAFNSFITIRIIFNSILIRITNIRFILFLIFLYKPIIKRIRI